MSSGPNESVPRVPATPQQEAPLPGAVEPSSPVVINWGMYPDIFLVQPHEPLEYYVPGGFHPVSLGDTLRDGQYTIRCKLGYGGQSTVWLAFDTQATYDTSTLPWVAIKIKSASSSRKGLDGDPEIAALKNTREILPRCKTDKPKDFCPIARLLSIHGAQWGPYLHCDRGPWTVPRGSRPRVPAWRRANATRHGASNDSTGFAGTGICISAWNGWYPDKNEEVRFIDWGLSYPVGESVTVLEQPDSLRPPETFFGHTFTYKHDLWRAGSVIYSLFYQKPPFSCIGDPKHFFIRRLVAKLGPLPPIWNAEWEEMMVGDKHAEVDAANMPQELLQDTFEPRRQEIVRQWHTDLQGYELDEHFGYDLETLKCLLRPIQGLMQHEPEKRISLQEAMSCIEWTDYRKQGSFTSEDEDEE